MLVGVELLVVQLHGDDPHEKCEDLQTAHCHMHTSLV